MELLKERLYHKIEEISEYIYKIGTDIYNTPETGFKEYRTSQYVREQLAEAGFDCQISEGITGVKVTIDTGKEGPGVAVLAELDALQCASHPDADPETGAVHCCGHNVMQADILGLAKAVKESGIADGLAGKVHFIIVPAEEYSEIEYRCQLIADGKIKYPTGKAEYLYRGFFDDVDIAIMLHLMPGDKSLGIERGGNGFIAKKVKYIGKASHAASRPENGINALYAANLGLAGINYARETFEDESAIRVHPVIIAENAAVNIIPAEVKVETLVRANNVEAIKNTNQKVNNALIGGAVALGAKVEIEDTPGMMPLYTSEELINIAKQVGTELVGQDEIHEYAPSKGSSDLGDISTLMPAIEICIESIEGGLHTAEFRNKDFEKSYVFGTKMLGGILIDLLKDDAAMADRVIDAYDPCFKSKQEYFDFMNSLFKKNTYGMEEITSE